MKQQRQRPARRSEPQRMNREKDEIWPLSAREFMKLPASGLFSTGRRVQFTRLTSPGQAA